MLLPESTNNHANRALTDQIREQQLAERGDEGGGDSTTHEPSSELARLSKLLAPGAMHPLVTYMQL